MRRRWRRAGRVGISSRYRRRVQRPVALRRRQYLYGMPCRYDNNRRDRTNPPHVQTGPTSSEDAAACANSSSQISRSSGDVYMRARAVVAVFSPGAQPPTAVPFLPGRCSSCVCVAPPSVTARPTRAAPSPCCISSHNTSYRSRFSSLRPLSSTTWREEVRRRHANNDSGISSNSGRSGRSCAMLSQCFEIAHHCGYDVSFRWGTDGGAIWVSSRRNAIDALHRPSARHGLIFTFLLLLLCQQFVSVAVCLRFLAARFCDGRIVDQLLQSDE